MLGDGPDALHGEFTVQRSGRYVIDVTDAEGVDNLPVVRHVEAVPDAAPTVFFVDPARDVAVGPQDKVAVLAEAQDDFSLQELHLFIQRRAGAEWEKAQSWTVKPGVLTDREGAVLDAGALGLKVGDSLAYYMQANDGLRRADGADPESTPGRSRIYHVRVVTPELAGRSDEQARQALEDVVRKLIDMQKANLSATTDLSGRAAGDGADRADYEKSADALVGAEERIYETAGNAAVSYAGMADSAMTDALARIAADHVSAAVTPAQGPALGRYGCRSRRRPGRRRRRSPRSSRCWRSCWRTRPARWPTPRRRAPPRTWSSRWTTWPRARRQPRSCSRP